jgi:exopolysaccharide biosynthesis polyprenyl glycosylphosphotransferase
VLVLISLYASVLLRTEIGYGKPILYDAVYITLPVSVSAILVWQFIFRSYRVYSDSNSRLAAATMPVLLKAHVVAMMAFSGILYVVHRDFSRLQAFYYFLVLLGLLILTRLIWNAVRQSFEAPKSLRRRVLIVGSDAYAQEIGRSVADFASAGLHLAGYIPHDLDAAPPPDLKVLGRLRDLEQVLREHHIDEVILCDRSFERSYLQGIIERLSNLPLNFRIAPDYSDLAYFRTMAEDFAGTPLVSLRYEMLSAEQRFAKRIFDLVISALLLLLAAPLMMLIAVAIKLDSAGPILFVQQRVGERGRLFTMIKFRTMIWNAEEKITYTTNYKQADDPRVTRLGSWLRRTSLDELPQFWNVLKGEMSLVGPRPELPQVVSLYSPWQRKRFEVPQGMTGWWQIHGRADLPMYEHVDYDLFYIRNYSVWLDLRILAMTPWVVLRGRGAF